MKLLGALLCLSAGVAWAQGASVSFYSFEEALVSPCSSAFCFPDGTPVYIVWDMDVDGPDSTDALAPVGGGVGQWNYNQLPINGEETEVGCGVFGSMTNWTSNGTLLYPTTFYLRTCFLPAVYVSDTFSVVPGYNDVYVSHWTCQQGMCPSQKLRIWRPNGAEEVSIIHSDTIRWLGIGFPGPVSISLNRHYPIGEWEVLADTTENDGEFEWFVTDPLSDSCRIRVCAVEDTFCDISDGNFSITSSQGYLGLVRLSAPDVPVLAWDAGIVECPAGEQESLRLKNFGNEAIVVFQPLEPATPEFSRFTGCPGFLALAPGEVASCTVLLNFSPTAEGSYRDTLLIQTDAINAIGGYVRIPLTGSQIRTPAAPEVVIQPAGINAQISWTPVTESGGGCAIDVTAYLVFYAGDAVGPYLFHGFTTDTTYVHSGVVHFSPAMFYQVIATTEELPVVRGIPREVEMRQLTRVW